MRRQRRGGPACDGAGPGRGRRKDDARGSQGSLSGRTATRALVAVGAYVAQDLRDAEGLTRPMLRRAALRLALSRREPARRLGSAYLRLDPPAPGEVRQEGDAIEAQSDLVARPGRFRRRPSQRTPERAARRRRVEAQAHPVYDEHMLITLKDEHAAPAD